MADQEPKIEHINLRVVDADASEISFKIKRTTPFQKMFDAYAQKKGVNVQNLRFNFDQERLDPGKTPNDMDMEEVFSINIE